MNASVHIDIVTYNSQKDILGCLSSVMSQYYKPIDITVLDNNSSDGTIAVLLSAYPLIRILASRKNLGFGNAHNKLLQSIQSNNNDYYLMLNPDVVLEPGYVMELVRLLKKTNGSYATGKLFFCDTKHELYSVGHGVRRDGYAFNIGHHMKDVGQYEKPREVFGAPGAASLWSYAAINKLMQNGALFDPDMFMYNEDTDLDWRAKNNGFACWYVPRAIASHRDKKLNRTLSLHAVRNRYVSVVKNAFMMDLVLYNLPLIIVHCLYRIFETPREGLWLALQLLFSLPKTLQKRYHHAVSRDFVMEWFRWSQKELTEQPRTYSERYQSLKQRLSPRLKD